MAIQKQIGQTRTLKPQGKGWYWSNRIVVNPNAPKQDWVFKSGWVRKPTFIEKKTPGPLLELFSLRLRGKNE